MKRRNNAGAIETISATLGFEAQLWATADALRGRLDAAEYKHVVLGLIFLKYISDAFEEHRARLEAEREQGADPEDPDEYRAQNIFWVPPQEKLAAPKEERVPATIRELVEKDGKGRTAGLIETVYEKDPPRSATHGASAVSESND